ncbi:MAG: phosphonoacetaldehyde reductase [Nanoarchaeota archaeon]|nr:phosphonoacetaldehyde reductase [Nanoarchaeota archaeon]
MTHEIISGQGCISKLDAVLETITPTKILLVTGKQSYTDCGAERALAPLLEGYSVFRFSDFEVNAKMGDVEKGIAICKQENCDLVIGVGGGSVIDMAKAIALLVHQTGDIEAMVKGDAEIADRTVGSIMIPTTAGTGSESDKYSVVYIGKTKYSLTHESNLPDYAILDATFSMDLPSSITASSGIDALAQAIESYWSVKSTPASRVLSKKALHLVIDNLYQAVSAPTQESRENMLLGANFAGQAIEIASTTAPHAVSYPMTSYFDVAHGQAVGLTLPSFFEYNCGIDGESVQEGITLEDARQRMDELLGLLGAKDGAEAKAKLTSLMTSIGLATTLSAARVTDVDLIVEHGFNPQRMGNNPRMVTSDDLKGILSGLL